MLSPQPCRNLGGPGSQRTVARRRTQADSVGAFLANCAHACAAARSKSPSPSSVGRAVLLCWVPWTSARLQSPSTRNTVRKSPDRALNALLGRLVTCPRNPARQSEDACRAGLLFSDT